MFDDDEVHSHTETPLTPVSQRYGHWAVSAKTGINCPALEQGNEFCNRVRVPGPVPATDH